MPAFREVVRSASLGFVVGAILLGVGGRALMRVVALATGASSGFSVGGSLEVLAAGALYGTLAGLLLPCVPARLGRWRGVLHAGGLFVLIALVSDAARGAATAIALPARTLAVLAFGALLLVNSLVLVGLTGRDRRSTSSG